MLAKYTMKGFGLSYARKVYLVAVIIVIGVGILSRTVNTNILLFDKYLGDALYAALIYTLLRIWQPAGSRRTHANWAMIIVFAIELFQLTGIPLTLQQSGNALLELVAMVLGTHYSWFDVVAYAVGILSAYAVDMRYKEKTAIHANG